jgi:hypothetical protein
MTFGKRGGGGRRGAPREAAPLLAVYKTVTQSHEVVLVDVSNTGARLRGPQIPEVKDELFVSIGTIKAFGKVAWVDQPEFGVAFDPPLPAEILEALREQVNKGAGLSPEEKAAIDVWVLGSR